MQGGGAVLLIDRGPTVRNNYAIPDERGTL